MTKELTEAQKQRKREREKERYHKKRAEETLEAKRARLDKEKEKREEKKQKLTKEQYKAQEEHSKQCRQKLIDNETPEEHSARLEAGRLRQSQIRASEAPEEHERRLQQNRDCQARVRESETPEEQALRLQQHREYQSQVRASETPEEHERRLQQNREYQARVRESETPAEQALRLQQHREYQSQVRASETPEEHERCLESNRQRLVEKNRQMVNFEKSINSFCSQSCEICKKLCYPNQIYSQPLNDTSRSYLPPELSVKLNLLVCSRCQSHLKSKATTFPPKAYWNNLDPGIIPEEIKVLNQSEKRLLSRIIPFVKVVKFYGAFGQYGFRGQAILFAQDIFEVTDTLPRASDTAGIIVITEELQNLNITREFLISRERIYNALNWLVANNPLYRDVTIDNDARLVEQDFFRENQPEPQQNNEIENFNQVDPTQHVSAYMSIGDDSRIVRATWHQGNQTIFTSGYAGVQCCAMVLANLVKASFNPPSQWDSNTLNENMIQGDRLYSTIRDIADTTGNLNIVDANGFLNIRSFDVIKKDFILFEKGFSVTYGSEAFVVGNLDDRVIAKVGYGQTLFAGLDKFFKTHDYGLFIGNSKSLGLIKYDKKLYLTDSHSCGPKGAIAGDNGKACVIECDDIKELTRLIKRAFRIKNVVYSIDYIRVTSRGEIMNIEDYIQNFKNLCPNVENFNQINIDETVQIIDSPNIENPIPIVENHLQNIEDLNQDIEDSQQDRNELGQEENFNADMQIENSIRILRASWHQGNQAIFTSGYAGIQCCAMVIANLVRASFFPPNEWNTEILNQNMIEGDRIYSTIRDIADAIPSLNIVDASGFLNVRSFNVIRDNFVMFERRFSISYDSEAHVVGNLEDIMNPKKGYGQTLLNGLNYLFKRGSTVYGVIISNSKSLGLIKNKGKFYLTDSHSCGPTGATAGNNGKACVIECETLKKLTALVKRVLGDKNAQYDIDYIIVTSHGEIMNNEIDNQNVPINRQNVEDSNHMDIDDNWQNFENFNPNIENSHSHNQNVEDSAEIQNARNTQDLSENLNQNEEISNENAENLNESFENVIQNVHHDASGTFPMQTSIMLPIDSVQPIVEEELNISENLNLIVRKTKDNIVNESHELKAEEFAWFYLFPYGINGFKESRSVKITPLDYYQSRILSNDTRFQKTEYLFYSLSMHEYYRIQSNISACGKKIVGQDGKVEDVHLYIQNLRGSAAYWRKALNELIAQIRCLGPPHYFVTFSCNDLNWLDMRKALLIADGRKDVDPASITLLEAQKLIEKYPVIVSRHFMNRVNALMKFLKNSNDVFGGKLKDFWWRIEFQNRGSPHLHMVVWIEDCPSFDTEEGIQMIDRVISCEMPDEESEPELYNLVKKCQRHHHTHTCNKNAEDSTERCRFKFPREECSETRIVAHSSDEFIRNGGRVCSLKRRKEDRWINNYSPEILKMWKGNIDIQVCGTNEAIAFYVAKYISKSEPTNLDSGVARAIRQIQREDTDIKKKLFKICMRILKERQVSACECAYRLCHLNLRDSSRKCVFLNTRKPEQRYKVIQFDAQGRANGYCSNIFERYEKRPQMLAGEHPRFPEIDFVNMNLTKFAMTFEPFYPKKKGNDDENVDEDALDEGEMGLSKKRLLVLTDNSKMVFRNNPAVVRVPYLRVTENSENYYYSLLLQYFPYKKENDLLEEFDNARDAFLAREQQLRQISSEMEFHQTCERQLEMAFNQVHAFNILENPIQLENDMEEVEEIEENEITDDQFQTNFNRMNGKQKEILTTITRSIQAQINGDENRLRLFITGGAGVGKTFLLKMLEKQINRLYGKSSTKKCSLTGVAARLINGSTLHSTLKLPVQKDGVITTMPQLTGIYLRTMRNQWRDIEFFFIDEISMVSYEMLCMIDSRLRQLKNSDSFFGGINIILFGDLFQLPPIKSHQVFDQPGYMIPATHLWRLFTLCELTENMRQHGDNTFINILNALRVGEITGEHLSVLLQKVSTEETGEFAIGRALRIYPTNALVNEHNKSVLQFYKDKNTETFTITAQDRLVDANRNADNVNLDNIIPTDINKTGGYPKELEIFVGAKVMLRTNIDVSKGLVNGAIGFITEIIWSLFRRAQMYDQDIPSVRIEFEPGKIYKIDPKSVQFPAKFSYGTAERRMLPLVLSWASTVHKMQGSTIDYAVINLGSKLFDKGQAYVALSRVRSLNGLQIEELDCSKLTGEVPCNTHAKREMNRLRNRNNNSDVDFDD